MKKFIKYPKSKINAASEWGENSITMWQEEDMVKYLDEEEPEVAYNFIYNAFIGHVESTMSGYEAYYICSTKALAKEAVKKFREAVYADEDDKDYLWRAFDGWLKENGIIELVNENNDFEIDERYDVIIDSNTGKAYNLNIVAEYIERF